MRNRRLTVILAAVAIAMAGLLWFLATRPAAKPALAIGVLEYRTSNWGGGPVTEVRLGITNFGRIAIRISPFSFNGHSWVRTEQRDGRVTLNDRSTVPIWHPLKPGSFAETSLMLSTNTLHWQVAYGVRSVGLGYRVALKIPSKWRMSLYPILRRLFKEEPEYEVASEVFECPSVRVKPSNDEVQSIFDFHLLSPDHASTALP